MVNLLKTKIVKELEKFIKSKNKSNIITELNNSTNLFEQGYLDSFGLVELILMVEKKFNINISNANFFEKHNNIENISDYILKKNNIDGEKKNIN